MKAFKKAGKKYFWSKFNIQNVLSSVVDFLEAKGLRKTKIYM